MKSLSEVNDSLILFSSRNGDNTLRHSLIFHPSISISALMMKLISTLSVYLRYSACLLVFVALTACGDDEAVTGETSSNNPSSSDETTPTTGTLAAPGSSCSCDADCAAIGSNTGVCLGSICMTDSTPVDTCDEEGTDTNCPTGFQCWFGLCWPDCVSYDCDATCDRDGSCAPMLDSACDSSCSRHC